MSITEV